jgi:hypothetical protein
VILAMGTPDALERLEELSDARSSPR